MPSAAAPDARPLKASARHRMAAGVLAVVFGFLALGPDAARAAAAEMVAPLASHKAVYNMRLASAAPASGIVGAAGTMTYIFSNGCDGWTVETRTELTMLQTQGGPLETSWDFLSWESKDSTAYRFRVRNTRDGDVVEAYDGEARITRGEGGKAIFHLTEQDDKVIDLPTGVLFPTDHTQELVRRANRGQRFFAAPVFDGSGVKGAFTVTAAIGNPVPENASHAVDAPDLLGGPAWPMTLAFFSPEEPDSDTPDFEVSLRYHANGVAENLVQDFGDFALRGILKELEKLPPPDC